MKPALGLLAGLALAFAAPGLATAATDGPGSRPGAFLEGASVARAKAMALDAAMLKGWHVAQGGRDYSLFETILEEPAAPGPMDDRLPPEQTLLRIRADFIETPAGVNAYLQAQEIWWEGTPGKWVADVTDLYRANLMKALDSLQRQWSGFHKAHPGRAPRVAAPRVRVEPGAQPRPPPVGAANPQPLPVDNADVRPLPADNADVRPLPVDNADVRPLPVDNADVRPLPVDSADVRPLPVDGSAPRFPSPSAADVPPMPPAPATGPETPPEAEPALPARYDVGVWAYYAEQFAREHGCAPGDLGAVLIEDTGANELHRVQCADGSTRMVRCDREQCRDSQ